MLLGDGALGDRGGGVKTGADGPSDVGRGGIVNFGTGGVGTAAGVGADTGD